MPVSPRIAARYNVVIVNAGARSGERLIVRIAAMPKNKIVGTHSARRRIRAGIMLPLAVCIATLGAGCAQQTADGSANGSAVTEAATSESSAQAVAAELYRDAIANAASHFENKSVEDELVQSGEYTYALAEVENLDAPALLLCLHGDETQWGGIDVVSVLYVNADGKLADYENTLSKGVSSVGGYRGEVYASAYGDGLLTSELSSGTGDTSTSRLSFDGSTWTSKQVYHGSLALETTCTTPLETEQRELTWTATDDSSVLDALEDGTWTSNVDDSATDAVSAAEEAGLQVYTGTLRVLDTDGVCALQGVSNPNPGYSEAEAYTLLVFDEETDVDANNGDGIGRSTDKASMIRLALDDVAWSVYDGQQVTIAIDPNLIWWPSDASMPLGQPKTSSFTVLSE